MRRNEFLAARGIANGTTETDTEVSNASGNSQWSYCRGNAGAGLGGMFSSPGVSVSAKQRGQSDTLNMTAQGSYTDGSWSLSSYVLDAYSNVWSSNTATQNETINSSGTVAGGGTYTSVATTL